MTNQEIIDYYVNLLIIQYIGLPKARGTVEAYVSQVVADQIYTQVENAFKIDTATGVQLDIIGKYVGVVREAQGPNGFIILSEPDFRRLIRIAQIKNTFGSSLAEIQELLFEFFAGEIYVFDYGDMRMSYIINSAAFSNDLVQMMIIQNLLPYPMAVQRGAVIYYPVLDGFFGFRTYDAPGYNNTPFNDYDDYQMDWPWLDYDYAINPDQVQNYSLLTQNMLDIIVQQNMDLMWT